MTRAVGASSGAGEAKGSRAKDGLARDTGQATTSGGLRIARVWTTEGVHPYDEVTWERRDVVMTNWRGGSGQFGARGVEVPGLWGGHAANIVTTKDFPAAGGTPGRGWRLAQPLD